MGFIIPIGLRTTSIIYILGTTTLSQNHIDSRLTLLPHHYIMMFGANTNNLISQCDGLIIAAKPGVREASTRRVLSRKHATQNWSSQLNSHIVKLLSAMGLALMASSRRIRNAHS